MDNNIAFVFPGQGSQYVGMGKEIWGKYDSARIIMDKAMDILDFDIQELCFEGPLEKLNLTEYTQSAIYTVNMMIYEILKENNIKPTVVAGHSLGEYSALAAAGVYSFENGLKLVRQRGILMEDAMPAGKGSMAAIIGLESDTVSIICKEVNGICEVANFNSPQQIVISGDSQAIKSAMEIATSKDAKRVIELDVSGPFHSSLMMKARNKLKTVIDKTELSKPSIPIIANVTGNYVNSPVELKETLVNQLTNSVRWVESIELMINDGIDTIVEVGPGKVLKGLIRRINKSINCYNVEDINTFNILLDKLGVEYQCI
jgi:[acyl-carrier-protein] S-malonyltransferase